MAEVTRPEAIAVELLRHVARPYPDVDPVTVRKALDLAAREIRERIKAAVSQQNDTK